MVSTVREITVQWITRPSGDRTGDQGLRLLRAIRDGGWRGPVGVLDHRGETDSEVTLRANLVGLDRLRQQLAAEAKR